MTRHSVLLAVLFAVLATTNSTTACLADSTEIVTEINRLCIQGPSSILEVEVQFATCLSSSCDTVKSAECTLQESNGVVKIEGIAEIYHKGRNCTFDCNDAMARCSIELPPGEYTLKHAEQNTALTLPTKLETCHNQGESQGYAPANP